MRLRHAVGATLGALTLLATVPASAAAVDGYATYAYGDSANPQFGKLDDIEGRMCIEIPEVESGKSVDAWKFANKTPSNVFLFPEAECQGVHTVVNAGGTPDSGVKFRSVYFAQTNT
ncbi:hypothetical protein [Streptomyces sp. NPDC057302]|uniref:hypothetical protein n=1 Tax=Streptomyces sp. NPDC057302 TaxID=3346094 RepID=UPI00362FA31F